jgi:hypothetical protein
MPYSINSVDTRSSALLRICLLLLLVDPDSAIQIRTSLFKILNFLVRQPGESIYSRVIILQV